MKNNSKGKIPVAKGTSVERKGVPAKKTAIISKQPILSVPSKDKTNKVPVNIPKPATNRTTALRMQKYVRKREDIKSCSWATMPCSFLITICQFSCSNLYEVYLLSRVCRIWREYMVGEMGPYFWNEIKDGQNVSDFGNLKIYLQKFLIENQEKMSFQFEKKFTKLFNYGSTKQNLPNKLIQNLSLELLVKLNNQPEFIQPFRLRTFNFSSYICTKIEQIKEFKYDFYTPHNMFKDNISIEMNFRSKKFKVSHKVTKKYSPQQIVEMAIKQKAFNYYLDKNFVFTYFEGDNHFLYIFYEISVLELVNIFREEIKSKHRETLEKKVKKQPMYKQLCETEFEDFVQYIKFQADFEIHFSYHNSIKQIFTHCDTKVFPVLYDSKHAHFEVKIDDSFDRVATYKLDNKMGMSESVNNLYLLDFVLKDRDKFLIIFSGFLYARQADQKQRQSIEDYFNYSENSIKILECRQKKYWLKFVIIEQQKRNFMKDVKFDLNA